MRSPWHFLKTIFNPSKNISNTCWKTNQYCFEFDFKLFVKGALSEQSSGLRFEFDSKLFVKGALSEQSSGQGARNAWPNGTSGWSRQPP